MAFLMIKIEAPKLSDTELNTKLKDNSNQGIGIAELKNLLQAIAAGTVDAQVDVAVRATTQAITPDGNGEARQYNLK